MAINNLNQAGKPIADGDQLPLYQASSGQDRRFAASALRAYAQGSTPVAAAALPSAASAGSGARAFVSDATATTFASVVAGGGPNQVPVYSDGVAWRIG
jgi:hypothetical protein